ncbi:hypothetical protein FRC00_014040 [Tulasnella sp. 408]|nr:hypothetical protein FRC00_014040 [Tulasnella sp. 408]
MPTASPPIRLPHLKTLAFDYVPTPIITGIIPLIQTSASHTVTVHEDEVPVLLELQETTTELIAKPISLSKTLKLKLEVDDGTCLHIRSEPVVAKECVYWARNALRGHGGASGVISLEVEWARQEFQFPFTLLEHCPMLASLRIIDYYGATLHPLIQFLGGNSVGGNGVTVGQRFPLPNLNSLCFYAKTIPNLEDCVGATKTLLERRYPVLRDGVVAGDPEVLTDLRLPFPLVHAVQQHGVVTSLDFKKVIRGTKVAINVLDT